MTDALCETTKTEKEYESVCEEDCLIYTHSLSLFFFKLHFWTDEKLLTASLAIWSGGLDLGLIELLDPISSLKAH